MSLYLKNINSILCSRKIDVIL